MFPNWWVTVQKWVTASLAVSICLRDLDILIFIEKMLGLYSAGHRIQFNHFKFNFMEMFRWIRFRLMIRGKKVYFENDRSKVLIDREIDR